MTTKKATNAADTWLGTPDNDAYDGLGGNDTLDGGAGNDTLKGGIGNDLVAGGAGADIINGNAGNDVLDGGIGADKLFGDAGNDTVYGGSGLDTLNGGSGNDYLFGGVANDVLYGGPGSDLLEGGDGVDILADTNNRTTYGNISTEQDEMIGGQGADIFYGGYDTMWGNDGNDVFNVKNQGTVYGGTGDDTIKVTNSNTKLNSWLEGGFGSDTLIAGAGNDTLFSGYGADKLQGGAGDDHYVITFDNQEDSIIEKPKEGLDTVYFIRDFKNDGRDDDKDNDTGQELDPPDSGKTAYNYNVTLPNNVENGALDDQVYMFNPDIVSYTIAKLNGNALNNQLLGSSLNDILDGGAGNDTIIAGDGEDIIFAGKGIDTINGGAGIDLIATSVSFNLSSQATGVENIFLLDVAAAKNATGTDGNNLLIGNRFANTLTGNAGDDILDAWYNSPSYATVKNTTKETGNDKLIGGIGSDIYRIDSVEDKVIESAPRGGIDTVEFKGAIMTDTYVLPDGVENLKMLGNLKEGDGNNLNNRIIGDSTGNSLKGGYGDDYLDGGSGTDNFEGGYGDDTFLVDNLAESIKEIAGQGNDWVQSDKINLDLGTQGNWIDIENARLTGTNNLYLTGRETNNILIGNKGSNVLTGGDGIDTLEGGLGNDTYVVDTTTDLLTEVSNELDSSGKIKNGWIDTLQSDISFDMSKLYNFENLSLTGKKATQGTGNANDNEIRGNDSANVLKGLAGNDILDGAGGVDTLIGGAGNDTYRLSNDGDAVKEVAGEGMDTIEIQNTFSLSQPSLGNNIENLTLTGTIAVDGTGTKGNNVLTGNSASNALHGLGGSDTLVGKEGMDTLVGGAGADIVDLTESKADKDTVRIALGDSPASVVDADKVLKFAPFYDTLDLPSAKIAATTRAIDGKNAGEIKSHKIDNGILKFDDTDSFVSPLSISSNNVGNAIEYLKQNITHQETVAFQVGADVWVFQDDGANDTVVDLVGVSNIISLSTGGFLGNTIHIV